MKTNFRSPWEWLFIKMKEIIRILDVWYNSAGDSKPLWRYLPNSVDTDQLASSEASWSGYSLFVIQFLHIMQQTFSKDSMYGTD